ncbi:hypothetical protein KRMM14A1259_21630 [Krasilnikovia sp. MM14-A1259]
MVAHRRWVDDEDGSIVVQGWKIDDAATLAAVQATGPIPDRETVLRLPSRAVPFLQEVCGAGSEDR